MDRANLRDYAYLMSLNKGETGRGLSEFFRSSHTTYNRAVLFTLGGPSSCHDGISRNLWDEAFLIGSIYSIPKNLICTPVFGEIMSTDIIRVTYATLDSHYRSIASSHLTRKRRVSEDAGGMQHNQRATLTN